MQFFGIIYIGRRYYSSTRRIGASLHRYGISGHVLGVYFCADLPRRFCDAIDSIFGRRG